MSRRSLQGEDLTPLPVAPSSVAGGSRPLAGSTPPGGPRPRRAGYPPVLVVGALLVALVAGGALTGIDHDPPRHPRSLAEGPVWTGRDALFWVGRFAGSADGVWLYRPPAASRAPAPGSPAGGRSGVPG